LEEIFLSKRGAEDENSGGNREIVVKVKRKLGSDWIDLSRPMNQKVQI